MSDKFTMGLQISAVPELGGLTTTVGSDNFSKIKEMRILEGLIDE